MCYLKTEYLSNTNSSLNDLFPFRLLMIEIRSHSVTGPHRASIAQASRVRQIEPVHIYMYGDGLPDAHRDVRLAYSRGGLTPVSII